MGIDVVGAVDCDTREEGMLGCGGAKPDDKIGSEEPVSRDAAVAAAATLQTEHVRRELVNDEYTNLRRVPKTSMLLEEIRGARFSTTGGGS